MNQLVGRQIFRATLVLALGCVAAVSSQAQKPPSVDKTRENLMVVLRESEGANKQEETLVASGKGRAKLPDGKEIEFDLAHFSYLGDMHLRFVFDAPSYMRNADAADLDKLNLKPDEALALAIANIRRVYGNPDAKPFAKGTFQVQGKSPDVDSSYFLDRDFWRALLKQHPDGSVVAVPKRGGLIFVPVSDEEAVTRLRKGVVNLYSTSGRMRVSSALYLFKNDKWTVFQAAAKPQ